MRTGTLWRNKKNQDIYTMLLREVINATNANYGQIMVVYRDKDDRLYARERTEFLEKFEQVTVDEAVLAMLKETT